jgi:hypothetical protein
MRLLYVCGHKIKKFFIGCSNCEFPLVAFVFIKKIRSVQQFCSEKCSVFQTAFVGIILNINVRCFHLSDLQYQPKPPAIPSKVIEIRID